MPDEHDCLKSPRGEQHCLTCHQQGHNYFAHWRMLGLSPVFAPGFTEVFPERIEKTNDQ